MPLVLRLEHDGGDVGQWCQLGIPSCSGQGRPGVTYSVPRHTTGTVAGFVQPSGFLRCRAIMWSGWLARVLAVLADECGSCDAAAMLTAARCVAEWRSVVWTRRLNAGGRGARSASIVLVRAAVERHSLSAAIHF